MTPVSYLTTCCRKQTSQGKCREPFLSAVFLPSSNEPTRMMPDWTWTQNLATEPHSPWPCALPFSPVCSLMSTSVKMKLIMKALAWDPQIVVHGDNILSTAGIYHQDTSRLHCPWAPSFFSSSLEGLFLLLPSGLGQSCSE